MGVSEGDRAASGRETGPERGWLAHSSMVSLKAAKPLSAIAMARYKTGRSMKDSLTTIPIEDCAALGIADEVRAERRHDSGHEISPSVSSLPNAVSSLEEFWDGVELAMSGAASGRTCDACELSRELRERRGLV